MQVAYRVVLDGAHGVPPTASTAVGWGSFVFNDNWPSGSPTLSYSFGFTGLDFGSFPGGVATTPSGDDDVTSIALFYAPSGGDEDMVFNIATDNVFALTYGRDANPRVNGVWDVFDTFAPNSDFFSGVAVGDVVDIYAEIATNAFPNGAIRGRLQVYATDGAETISGSEISEHLTGLGGNDTISGFDGDDTLDGGNGSDTVLGGDGDDVLIGKPNFELPAQADSVSGGAGDDLIHLLYMDSADTLDGGDGFDLLYVTGNISIGENSPELISIEGVQLDVTPAADAVFRINQVVANALPADFTVRSAANAYGRFELYVQTDGTVVDLSQWQFEGWDATAGFSKRIYVAATAKAHLIGSVQDDLFDVSNDGFADGTMEGGLGDDRYEIGTTSPVIIEDSGGGYDFIQAQFFGNVVSYTMPNHVEELQIGGAAIANGNAQDNVMRGASRLNGLGGDDTLRNAFSNVVETLDGGSGADTASYAFSSEAVTVDLSIVGPQFVGAANGTDVLIDIENVLGSLFNDTLRGDAGANRLTGELGDDLLEGRTGADTLNGGDGADTLNGGDGADRMEGGAGNDIFYVNNSGDLAIEGAGAGTDVVRTSVTYELGANIEGLTIIGVGARNGTGNDLANTMTGNDAANKLRGLAGADTINAGAGADTLEGGAGIDFLRGEAGDDTYEVDSADDFVRELVGGGSDTVRTSITRALDPNAENLVITGAAARNGSGNSQDNQVTGNNAANTLAGRLGADTVNGGGGNDKINGGEGIDVLTGGAGADAFVFDAPRVATNSDTITDFSVADDIIHLDNSIFTALGADGALDPSMFRVGSAAADSNDFLFYNAATGALYYDANANAAGGVFRIATLTPGLALTAADFLVI